MGIFSKLFKKTENPTEEVMMIPENWTVSQTEINGNVMLVRKNIALEQIAGNVNYSLSCGIAFKILFPDENGLPNIENEPELDSLENDIFKQYESDLNSIVAIIITTSGFREYVLYTKNAEEFNLRLNELKKKYSQYELTSYNNKDKNWSTYKSF